MQELITLAKPIQKRLLIHTVIYKEKQADDGWGNEYKEPVIINQVRIEPKTKLVRSNTGESVESTTTIFWDCVFSSPATFINGSKITFEGIEYELRQTDKFYDADRLHHLELRVI